MTIPRQLAPTVGPAHGGVEFLEGSFPRFEKIIIFLVKNNQFRRIYMISVATSRNDVQDRLRGFRVAICKAATGTVVIRRVRFAKVQVNGHEISATVLVSRKFCSGGVRQTEGVSWLLLSM